MGFFEGVGQLCYLLSKTPTYTYVVLDQHKRQYTVEAESEDKAVSKVLRDHPFTVHANRTRAIKVR